MNVLGLANMSKYDIPFFDLPCTCFAFIMLHIERVDFVLVQNACQHCLFKLPIYCYVLKKHFKKKVTTYLKYFFHRGETQCSMGGKYKNGCIVQMGCPNGGSN